MRRALLISLLAGALPVALAQAPDENAPAPFITTPDEVVGAMLELAAVRADDLVVDLGSGDGRIPIAAARRFGARGLGIELDHRLVALSRDNARQAGVADRVAFVQGDVLLADLSGATVVTVYLLPWLIDRLRPRFLYDLAPGTRIVTHAFAIKGWSPDETRTVRHARLHPGQGDASTLFLWTVPADLRGAWRAQGLRITLYQNYQRIEAEATLGDAPAVSLRGRVAGREISLQGEGLRLHARLEDTKLVGRIETDGASRAVSLERVR